MADSEGLLVEHYDIVEDSLKGHPDIANNDLTSLARSKEWAKRQETKILVGTVALSTAATLVLNPLSQIEHSISEVGPWVATGLVAGEAAWIGGAAMMLASAGSSIKNPLKIRERFSRLREQAHASKMFKAGFTINTIGAVGQFGVATAGILKLPRESWGLLAWPAYDLGLTVAGRLALWRAIKPKAANE